VPRRAVVAALAALAVGALAAEPAVAGSAVAGSAVAGSSVAGSSVAEPAVAGSTGSAGAAARDRRPTAVVTLGDSYISGEAGRWKGNSADPVGSRQGTDRAYVPGVGGGSGSYDPSLVYGATAQNGCHRSDVSEVRSAVTRAGSAKLPVQAAVNLACSGAVTANLLRASVGGVPFKGEAPQDDQLAVVARGYRVRAVVVSIGGNDAGFGSILGACVAAYTGGTTPCAQTQQAALEPRLPTVAAAVGAVLDDVRATMADAGYRPVDYRLVLQTYPAPTASAADWRYPGPGRERETIGGCPLYDTDADWNRDWLVPALADLLAQVARGHGAQLLDVRRAAGGHELCAATAQQSTGTPDSRTAEWIRFIDLGHQGDSAESLHPNAYGQRALGRCLALALRARERADVECAAQAGRGPQDVRLTRIR
jgi:hypothetical protein